MYAQLCIIHGTLPDCCPPVYFLSLLLVQSRVGFGIYGAITFKSGTIALSKMDNMCVYCMCVRNRVIWNGFHAAEWVQPWPLAGWHILLLSLLLLLLWLLFACRFSIHSVLWSKCSLLWDMCSVDIETATLELIGPSLWTKVSPFHDYRPSDKVVRWKKKEIFFS